MQNPFVATRSASSSTRAHDTVTLAERKYSLKFKSDGGDAYNSWDDLPPTVLDWGISVIR